MNPLYAYDRDLAAGCKCLIGVDEAGRGALAGPVVVAAVRLDYNRPIEGINDSKLLTPAKRERLFELILESALAWHIAEFDAPYIDAHNILQATLQGMRQVIQAIATDADLCLIDGNQTPSGLPCTVQSLVHGDSLSACIAAASILAKVHRDRLLRALDGAYPLYGFARHKGYGTSQHLQALREHGPCALHRFSYQPVAQALRQNPGNMDQ
ncbi:MAG TPA: ribonuclease HII [Candidatus Syntrophosphaera sp.]|nr:ribonuclease HII [Candidatus Syntrophosphaera sp.]